MEIDDFIKLSISLSNAINTIVFFLILICHRQKLNNKNLAITIAISIIIFVSIIANVNFTMTTRLVGLLICFMGLFCINDYSLDYRVIKVIALIPIIFSIAPVIYIPFASNSENILFLFSTDNEATIGTFCGFSLHRNAYGFYAGLSTLLLMSFDYNRFFKLFSFIMLAIGLFLASSRSSILATLVCVTYFNWEKITIKLKALLIVVVSCIVGLIYILANIFDSRLFTVGYQDRSSLNDIFISAVLKSPILGYGGGVLINGDPCHNFIFQVSADYGIVALLCYLYLFYLLFKRSNINSRSILIFLIIIGLFQPYLSLNLPVQFMLISFLFVTGFNNITHNSK